MRTSRLHRCFFVRPCRDEVRDDGRAADVLQYGFLARSICLCDASMLAQMLTPGVHEERLDEPSFMSSVLKYAPGIGAVASALCRRL
jgi:hypothetical protein